MGLCPGKRLSLYFPSMPSFFLTPMAPDKIWLTGSSELDSLQSGTAPDSVTLPQEEPHFLLDKINQNQEEKAKGDVY
jgi:hypothetical protein